MKRIPLKMKILPLKNAGFGATRSSSGRLALWSSPAWPTRATLWCCRSSYKRHGTSRREMSVKMMKSLLNMMNFVFKMLDFVFKMVDFVFKMLILVPYTRSCRVSPAGHGVLCGSDLVTNHQEAKRASDEDPAIWYTIFHKNQ